MPLSKTAPNRMVHDLRDWIEAMVPSPQEHMRSEVRCGAWLITLVLMLLMVEPLVYILDVPDSILYKVASLTISRYAVSGAFALSIILVLPQFVALSFFPASLGVPWPRKFAAGGAFLGAVAWLILADKSRPLDYGSVEIAFGARSLLTFLIGGIYGLSLNAQQMREAYTKTHPPAEPKNVFTNPDIRI